MPTSSPSNPSPESLFAAWLERSLSGEEQSFEAFCREHSAAASALRELHRHWIEVEQVARQFGLGGSLAQRLRSSLGSGVDPQVSLEEEGASSSDFSSEILSRLGGRGPASTRYRIQGEVAHGGMGAVLRVWDLDLRRHLAMKVMLGKAIAREVGRTSAVDQRTLARFLEEAQVTSQLDHPGIVPVHELGLDAEGRVYFTMKLVQGKTLKDVFDELAKGAGGWTQARVLGLIQRVCEAMSYAHAKGVIHRDLKPANVMVGKFGEVYVMDWGLAKILGRDDEKDIRVKKEPDLTSAVYSERRDRIDQSPDSPLYTMDGDVLGTPAYMSPEQALGRLEDMGPPADVYSVGSMLYHLLAGHMPYVARGARLNNYAVLSHLQSGPPQTLEDEAPDTPPELAAICAKAMAREPCARYPDMAALSGDLSAYLEGRVVQAYETGAWAEARKWVRRNRALAASLAAALVLAVGGLASTSYVQAMGRKAERIQRDRADAKATEAQENLSLAQRNEAEARAQQQRAEDNERLAKDETAKVLRLSDVERLRRLEVTVDQLWPPYPSLIGELEAWLTPARQLAERLPIHRATLAEMRAQARPWTPEERQQDKDTHPRLGELAAKRSERESLIAQVESGLELEVQSRLEARVDELDGEIAALEQEVEARRTWTFEALEGQWQHDVLATLVANLEELERGLIADQVVSLAHGWSVPRRLAFARELEASRAPGGEQDKLWAAALPAIRAAYPGLEFEAQTGLSPLGPDPQSGLWEFAHLMTGAPAVRGQDGKLVLREETGLVLVLLPGGTFWMGAQRLDPNARNYDPQADVDESPVHEVELTAFFLSKYEMTQGQWLRLTGSNPSVLSPGNLNMARLLPGLSPSLLYPVEQISWDDCALWLPRAGLILPSNAQWEYGVRAGTSTPWWTGAQQESLQGAANLADRYAQAHGPSDWIGIELWLDDGATLEAPVGSYRPNAFGLHEMTGNLYEWCFDGYDANAYSRSARKDPVTPPAHALSRVYRGSSYGFTAILARSASHSDTTPSNAMAVLGVRPARALDP